MNKDILKKYMGDSSTRMLLLTNILSGAYIISQGLNIYSLLLVYWIQSVIIGVFQFLKIINLNKFVSKNPVTNKQTVQSNNSVKYFMGFFFLFHYGLFHNVYFGFITSDYTKFFGLGEAKISVFGILLMTVLFFGNHLFSYLANKDKDESQPPDIRAMVLKPYVRILPMHLTLMLGIFLTLIMPGHERLIIILFIFLRTLADLKFHENEHLCSSEPLQLGKKTSLANEQILDNPTDEASKSTITPIEKSGIAITTEYSGLSIAACLVGLSSIELITAPIAVLLGILAIKDIKKNPEKKGKGMAIFAIIAGSVGSFILLIFLILFAVLMHNKYK